MDPLLIPVIISAFVFFFLGFWLSRRSYSRLQNVTLVLFSLLAAIPAILFAVYFAGILGEAIWFYTFRAVPGTELAACGAGLLAGWFQTARNKSPHIRKRISAGFIPFVLLIIVTIPYLKPIFLRPNWDNFNDQWSGDVCLQSSESSCGPASVATLLELFGKTASEKQIAQESFTSRRGTENWYLVRTIRRHGLGAKYLKNEPNEVNFSSPSIVGVRLGGKTGEGHFIAVLGKAGDKYIIGDPLMGREQLTQAELLKRYYFTGFSISVSTTRL
jgi:uncharacterized protein YneF (UPF0154 family)